MKAMLTSPNRAKVPVIFTEIGGIEDPWGKILADNWDVIWSTDGIAGAFIWEWQDQGMADKFPERWSIPSPGARGHRPRTTGIPRSRAAAAPSPPIARSSPIATGTSRWSIAR